MKVLKTPQQRPQANAICERLIGTIRRECLDWLIPLSEKHLRAILKEWVVHYNGGRVHKKVSPGVPDLPDGPVVIAPGESRHHLAVDTFVVTKSILGGLHYEYSLAIAPASITGCAPVM